jgi:hypothetical protein
MRREDRAAALAVMDQSQVLRPVFSPIVKGRLAASRAFNNRSRAGRNSSGPRLPARTAAAGDRTARSISITNRHTASPTRCERTTLHLRRAHKERQAVLTPRAWSSSLLATQRRPCDVARGEVNDQGVTPYCCARDVVASLMVLIGGAGLPGSFTGDFSFAITSAIARSSCGSFPASTDCGSLSTSMSGSTP